VDVSATSGINLSASLTGAPLPWINAGGSFCDHPQRNVLVRTTEGEVMLSCDTGRLPLPRIVAFTAAGVVMRFSMVGRLAGEGALGNLQREFRPLW
jgi:hypothetical protein